MLEQWLGELSLADFFRDYFHKQPLAQPGTARAVVPLLSWAAVGDLIAASSPRDKMVARSGKLLPSESPRNGQEFETLFRAGCSLVIRGVEDYDATFRAIADDFADTVHGPTTIHVFATPAGYHGFGWHYDCEDVFLAQTAGTKEYFLRQNTVNPEPHIEHMPADMQYEKEQSQLIACTMIPGDWLYIPSGWWHVGKSEQDSLGMSIGVLSERAGGVATMASDKRARYGFRSKD